jgi:FAD/FMN-containing dehydrogenase
MGIFRHPGITLQLQSEIRLAAPIVGRASDGNFHVCFLLHPSDPREMAEAERLNEQVVHRALSLDGTCTGEHGIGCGKIDFLIAQRSKRHGFPIAAPAGNLGVPRKQVVNP